MKKVQKIMSIFMLVMMTLTIVSNVVLATAAPNPSSFNGMEVSGTTGIQNVGNQIITIVSTVGSIASVIVLVVLGLKYMMGSAEEKAEYKKTLLPYVIGAGLVFAASAIAGIIFGFAQNLGASAIS